MRFAGHLHGFKVWMEGNTRPLWIYERCLELDHEQWKQRNTKDVQQKHGHVVNKMQNYPIKFEHDMSRRIVMTTPTMLLIQTTTRGIVNLFMTNVRNLAQKGWCTPVSKSKIVIAKLPVQHRPTLTWNNTLEPPLLVLRWQRPQQHPALKQSDLEDTGTSMQIP